VNKKSHKTLTVERIYDEPDLSGVSITDIGWSPDGRTLSYVRGEAARLEIWGYDRGSRSRRLLFDLTQLISPEEVSPIHERARRGQTPIRHWRNRKVRPSASLIYHWMPDGEGLLIEAAGRPPQLLDLASEQLRPINNSEVPIRDTRLSPNGRFVSYVRGYDLYLVDLHTGRESALTSGSTEVLRSATPDTMGDLLCDSGHWWSPDSNQIAYLQTDERNVPVFWYADLTSSRGQNIPERFPQPGDPIPHIALKVVSAKGHRWIDTRAWAYWYLARVAWLPDSRHLALQMLSRDQKTLHLVVADSYSGATRTILEETDPAWINVVDDLRFFSDGQRFLWSSERDSFRHLYLYDIHGTELLQLTSGSEASVAVEGLDESNNTVYYLVWPEPHTEGHLKRVTFSERDDRYKAGKAETLTRSPGTHFAHLSPDYAYFGDLVSTAVDPPRLDLHRTGGRKVATVEANPCKELADFGLRQFTYETLPAAQLGLPSDEMKLHGKLLEPLQREEGRKYPVIVYIYGGPLPGGFGLARNVMNYWRAVPELWLQMMAQRGFGIWSLDNRGSNAAPRGHDWETPIHRQLGRVELADQLEGVKHLKSLPWVDEDRVGIIGGSFGGFMTLNAMMRSSGTFKAAVAYAPVTNWREYDCVYAERYMDLPDDNSEGYEETAIAHCGKQLKGRLMLIHGASDPNVHVQHSIRLVDQLISDSENFNMMLYPHQVHMSFFGMGQSPSRLWSRITDFFEDSLGDG